ncbi:MAG: hypothetical protein ABI835_06645 [Chloroflexota bacterium]
MKRSLHVFRLPVILLCAAFVAGGAGYAQEDAPPDPQPTDMGTPGLVETLDHLNLPPVPVSPNATAPEPAPAQTTPAILPDTATTPPTNPFAELWAEELARNAGKLFAPWVISEHSRPIRKLLHQQPREPVFSETDPTTGDTLMVYSDYTFVLEDSQGTTGLTGHFGIVGEDTVIAIAEDRDGVRYAYSGGNFSAYTPDGDVLIGNGYTVYSYDFDEDENFLGLTDSDGGEYQVDVDDSGSVSIYGPDGYEVYADETGAFELYDDEGNLVASGELDDENHDEFAELEASLDDSTDDSDSDTLSDDEDNLVDEAEHDLASDHDNSAGDSADSDSSDDGSNGADQGD